AAAAAQRAVAAVAAPPGTLVAGAGGGVAAMLPMGAAPSGPVSAQSIDAYLAAKGSPMAGNGAAFVASGARYRIDPRLIVAISGAESNFGQITCGPNNAWGWACPNDPEDFATWAHGIETITRGLRIGYFDEGRSSVVLIQQKYAPSGAANDPTGLNNHWVNNVTKFLLEQGGNPNAVGDGPSSLPLPDLGGLGIVAGD
ncbi:MAG: conjugal transfer protein, partial [Thermoleophilia bacterium]|nr:conjugal transfer protein [Thermoleophilia bacterium]